MASSSTIIQHYLLAVEKYPGLENPNMLDNLWVIDGKLDVIDINGYCWDTYQVKIILPNNYPLNMPILIETSNKIIRDADWHINKQGVCCVGTLAKQYRELSDGITLISWLDRFVIPYFANHIRRLELGSYANGEFAHGVAGILEYYKELFQTQDVNSTLVRLRQVSGINSYSKNALCFCGSGKKYKRCFEKTKKGHMFHIPYDIILADIDSLKKINLENIF